MGKVVTREWWNVKVLSWNLHSFRLLEIIHVLDSISWVRCASGNVWYNHRFLEKGQSYSYGMMYILKGTVLAR